MWEHFSVCWFVLTRLFYLVELLRWLADSDMADQWTAGQQVSLCTYCKSEIRWKFQQLSLKLNVWICWYSHYMFKPFFFGFFFNTVCQATLLSMMKWMKMIMKTMTRTCSERFSQAIMSLTRRTGMRSLIQVLLHQSHWCEEKHRKYFISGRTFLFFLPFESSNRSYLCCHPSGE